MKTAFCIMAFALLIPLAFAQVQERDSLIIEGTSIDSGTVYANVRIWAVTFDSVFGYVVSLRWHAPLGGVSMDPIINYYPPLRSWDFYNDMVNNDSNYVRLFGFTGLDTLSGPPIFTNGQRANIIMLHFSIAPDAPPQTVIIDTMGALSFGYNPVFVPGQIIVGPASGLDDGDDIAPGKFALLQNYPNPFNAQTTIEYNLPIACQAKLDIFDILGRRVGAIVDEPQQAGHHAVPFDGSALSSGIYFYRLQAGELNDSRRLIVVK